MQRTLTLALWALAVAPLPAQTVQKCCGSENSTFLLGNLGIAPHTQCLYLPGDLANAAAGDIVRLYYRYGNTPLTAGQNTGNTVGGLMVRMGQTTATAFTAGTFFFTGLDTVLSAASFTIPPGAPDDWFQLPPLEPFTYDPTRTLIVDVTITASSATNFGCYGTTNNGRKLYSLNPTDATGTTIQDIGFDLDTGTGMGDGHPVLVGAYPDPADATLTVHAGGAVIDRAELLDAQGRAVAVPTPSAPAASLTMDVGALPPGLYLARVRTTEGRSGTVRWMKQ